jgi:protein-disulfide isomerase
MQDAEVADYVKTGKVRLIHRDFPLAMHQHSKLAARYANDRGKADVTWVPGKNR